MPPLAIIQTVALSIFSFIAVAVITAFISANVRRWANEKGHDAYLLTLWNMLPEWGHRLFSGLQPLRQLWWVWLCLGLSGGLGGALWLLSVPRPAVSVLSPDALAKGAAEAKAQQSAEDQRQLSDAQDVARKAMAAKETAEHNLDAASQQIGTLQTQLAQRDAALRVAPLAPPQPAPISEPLTQEDIETKLGIWDSALWDRNNLAEAYNGLAAAQDRWPGLIESDMGRKQLISDLKNPIKSYADTSDELDKLRSQNQKYKDVDAVLAQPHKSNSKAPLQTSLTQSLECRLIQRRVLRSP